MHRNTLQFLQFAGISDTGLSNELDSGHFTRTVLGASPRSVYRLTPVPILIAHPCVGGGPRCTNNRFVVSLFYVSCYGTREKVDDQLCDREITKIRKQIGSMIRRNGVRSQRHSKIRHGAASGAGRPAERELRGAWVGGAGAGAAGRGTSTARCPSTSLAARRAPPRTHNNLNNWSVRILGPSKIIVKEGTLVEVLRSQGSDLELIKLEGCIPSRTRLPTVLHILHLTLKRMTMLRIGLEDSETACISDYKDELRQQDVLTRAFGCAGRPALRANS
ncbi:Protein of unknown function [Gryllus bimaculatus]|nr:Protein of unknown function [Gryllus bimaculatus]